MKKALLTLAIAFGLSTIAPAKDSATNQPEASTLSLYNYQYVRPYVIAGPGTFILKHQVSSLDPVK